ncbi:DHH family phosphoesterase [Desulfocurvus sp. DL9XJH121]
MTSPARTISALISGAESFLIASHSSPDGDALGSSAALGFLLKALGKRVAIYNESGLPDQYAWLPLPCPVVAEVPDEDFDWTIALDCGDQARLGAALGERFPEKGSMNIDHHLGNPEYAEVNWVDPRYAAVGAMICDLARELSVPLSGGLGMAAYLAIVTDTGYFSYGSTRPETLEACAEIMRQGLDPAAFNDRLQNQWSLNRLKLWSMVLGDCSLHMDGAVGLMRVSREMLETTGTGKEDTEQLVNLMRRVKSVRAAILLREDGDELTKASLRSSGEVNVQAVAAALGGGGHKNAAGCTVHASLAEAEAVVLDAAARHLFPGEDRG